MNKKETAVIIDGKAIDLKEWIVSNQEKGLNNTEFAEVNQLGWLINDIIGVCATALHFISENDNLSSGDLRQSFGASAGEIARVLMFAQTLTPHLELELLTNIQKSLQEQ
ncbi:hypothetical protein [Riemerella columbipharyngis]|uniref:Uncharacterized protein n=1 Tax=Riemerella columbipharyngis TaxID=1071918 RepID=A0A1G7EYX2_9FLAO|nr:hypothetical protein [Riemerella columbipharyngis]SDE68862.1 hypothetical protein SAMN05421544_11829 [Riemerella columbipharyngis]